MTGREGPGEHHPKGRILTLKKERGKRRIKGEE